MLDRLIAIPAATLALAASGAVADEIEIGLLDCRLAITHITVVCGIGLMDEGIYYRDQPFNCRFRPHEGEAERYTGRITSVNPVLQISPDMDIFWAVFAPSERAYSAGDLSGVYAGGSADVAIGSKMVAKVLARTGETSFALRPLNVVGVEGDRPTLGVEGFELK